MDVRDQLTDIDSAEIRIWDLEARKAIVSINKSAAFGSPVFSPDGNRLAARAGRQLLKVWDATSGREILVKDLKYDVFFVSFSPVGNRVVVTGLNKEGQILDADTGEQVTTFFADGLGIYTPTFSPVGKRLAATTGVIKNLIVWNAESGEQVHVQGARTRYERCIQPRWHTSGLRRLGRLHKSVGHHPRRRDDSHCRCSTEGLFCRTFS